MTEFKRDGSHLSSYPPVEKWDDWVELDPEAWPRRVEKHYNLVPTVCFNCESACGLLAYMSTRKPDKSRSLKATRSIRQAADAYVRKVRLRSRRFTIPIAFCIR
jgi:anaerobic selenocysteine-containing dehydrogenase